MQRQKHFDPGEARTNPKTTKKLLQKPRQVEKHKLQHVNGELETGRDFKPCTFKRKSSRVTKKQTFNVREAQSESAPTPMEPLSAKHQ